MPDVISDALEELGNELESETGVREGVIEWPGNHLSETSNERLHKWERFGPVSGVCVKTVDVTRTAEIEQAAGIVSSVTSSIECRYLAGVTPAMRLIYEGHTYYIGAVIDLGNRGQRLMLYCGESLRG